MEIQGVIELIEETKSYGRNDFQKRLLVLNTGGSYPQKIPIEFVKNNCALLDSFAEGQEVKISLNLKGNEHNGKYYANIEGWKIEAVGSQPAQATSQPKEEMPNEPKLPEDEEDEDDLPF